MIMLPHGDQWTGHGLLGPPQSLPLSKQNEMQKVQRVALPLIVIEVSDTTIGLQVIIGMLT